jgi:hypothetical protein
MIENTQTELLFDRVCGKKVAADFSGGTTTSDAGMLLLSKMNRRLGLSTKIASAIKDTRNQAYVDHHVEPLLRQRIFQIACGYEDANDCNTLRKDPGLKTACGSAPLSGHDLASQPTMSRLENMVTDQDVEKMRDTLLDLFVSQYSKPPRTIILDADDTCDPTYGAQQMSVFNAYYDEYCFQPIVVFEGRTGRFVTAVLRTGKRPTGEEIAGILRSVIENLQKRWPKTRIILRGDSHYCSPHTLTMCHETGIQYILGLSVNKVVKKFAPMEQLEAQYAGNKADIRWIESTMYAAGSWEREERIIVKATVTPLGSDVRAIVTNMPLAEKNGKNNDCWAFYCQRGNMENRIKDLKNHLDSGRTSCTSFVANQFRLLVHCSAYVLMHAVREISFAGTEFVKSQFDTLRIKFLKIGARVTEIRTKIHFALPTSYPLAEFFRKAVLQT